MVETKVNNFSNCKFDFGAKLTIETRTMDERPMIGQGDRRTNGNTKYGDGLA